MENLNDYVNVYSYSIEYSIEDKTYLAKCLELGIMAHGNSHQEALEEIMEATRGYLLILIEDGDTIPNPLKGK